MASGNSTSKRGFASMDPEKQRAIARKGGQSVPDEKRSFSQNPELAARAGAQGGDGGAGRKGVFIRSAEGESVRSVAAGRVVFDGVPAELTDDELLRRLRDEIAGARGD
mgnify:CR=1 FL=1